MKGHQIKEEQKGAVGGGGSVVRGAGPRGQQLYSEWAQEPRTPSERQPEGPRPRRAAEAPKVTPHLLRVLPGAHRDIDFPRKRQASLHFILLMSLNGGYGSQ